MKQFKLTFLLTILMSMVGARASAYDIAVANDDGVTIYYNYINEGKELEVTYKSNSGHAYTSEVNIPEEVVYMNRKRKVTSIGYEAFEGCTGLTSITIPQSVTSIGSYAFSGCSGLTSITIPQSVTSIIESAFENCKNMRWINIMVTDYSAFCNNKVTYELIEVVHHYFYYGQEVRLIDKEGNEIKEYIIPEDVTSIGNDAFRNCSGLTSVTIPNSVTRIGGGAFFGCRGLTSIEIPNSVTSIGSSAFYDCTGLKKVIVSDIAAWYNISFQYYGNPLSYAHHLYNKNGTEITDLVIPNSVTSIGDRAFSGCSGLTSITIPNSVTSIGDRAFSGCTGLTSVTIPNSVTSIGSSAFSGCSGLTSITIPNSVTSIGYFAFEDCSGLTSIEIPNSVTSIGDRVFSGCTGLTSITIPNSVTSIGENAFNECNNLRYIVSLIEKPFTIYGKNSNNRVFSVDVYNNISLYVPTGTINRYKYTDGWGDFVWIEEGYPKFILHYLIDDIEYKSYEYDYGETITPEAEPTKEGHTFSGWSEIPATMPDHDVTVTGTFYVNQYTITYMIDDEVYQTESVDYGSTITPLEAPVREGYTFEWIDVPETMPAHDIIIVGSYTSGINAIKFDDEDVKWYTLDGHRIDASRKGLNIVRMSNGKTKKVLVK